MYKTIPFSRVILCFASFAYFLLGNSQDYSRLVDSADANIDFSSIKALKFLDSIPVPLEKSIKGRIGDYYALKSLIYDEFENYPIAYQYNILALKYAEKEKNYETAGEASLELFKNIYFNKRDSTAFNYLEKARYFYKLSEYKYGKVEVDQMEAYVKLLNNEYEACNKVLLEQLDTYSDIKDDAYYYMFALFMITSNYIHLEDLKKAQLYYNRFEKLENNSTIIPFNYYSFKSAVNICFAEIYFEKNELALAKKYLEKSITLKAFMGEGTKRDFFSLYSDYYSSIGDLKTSKVYLDSLRVFEGKMFNNVLDSSFDINERFLDAKNELEIESNRVYIKSILIGLLICSLIGFSFFWLWNYKKQKFKVIDYENQKASLNYLQGNHEKLRVKVKGLEGYINEVKREVKAISTVDEVNEQRNKINELYKNVRLNSSTVLSKNENHLELINDLNVDFFSKISEKFPQLSDSEIIICYYLYTEFKSKEIAVFLGSSTRAIESKRYRIRKKLDIQERHMSMFEFFNIALNTSD